MICFDNWELYDYCLRAIDAGRRSSILKVFPFQLSLVFALPLSLVLLYYIFKIIYIVFFIQFFVFAKIQNSNLVKLIFCKTNLKIGEKVDFFCKFIIRKFAI